MGKSRASAGCSAPAYRELSDEDFQADGLPNVSRYGPLEIAYARDEGAKVPFNYWIARFHGLPAYISIAGDPASAVEGLVSSEGLRGRPIYETPRPHVGRTKIVRNLKRDWNSLLAASEVRNFGADGIRVTAKAHRVRAADVHSAAHELTAAPGLQAKLQGVSRALANGHPQAELVNDMISQYINVHADRILTNHEWELQALKTRECAPFSGKPDNFRKLLVDALPE